MLNSAAFATQKMKGEFTEFAMWLAARITDRRATISLHKYLPFFLEAEELWQTFPSYPSLLEHFGAAKLRKVQLPVQWLAESNRIVVTSEIREQDSERRRIKSILQQLESRTELHGILLSYYNRLLERQRNSETSLRSVRLALTPAVGTLGKVTAIGGADSFDNAVREYLSEKPGQRAAISGFLTFLRETQHIHVGPLIATTIEEKRKQHQHLKKCLMDLLRENSSIPGPRMMWLRLALPYFHDLPYPFTNSIANKSFMEKDEGIIVTIDNHQYWIPLPEIITVNNSDRDRGSII